MSLFPVTPNFAGYPVTTTGPSATTVEAVSADILASIPPPDSTPTFDSLVVTGTTQCYSSVATTGDMYSNAYHGNSGAAAIMMAAGGAPVQFLWDGSAIHILISGSDLYSWHTGLGKSFVIDHPTDSDRYLIHACLEGPEAAVFYRGEITLDERGRCEVELPDYFEALTRLGTETVQLTPILDNEDDPFGPVAATRVEAGGFVVRGQAHQHVAWRVEAERADIDRLVCEPLKSDVVVKGEGPYRWIEFKM